MLLILHKHNTVSTHTGSH